MAVAFNASTYLLASGSDSQVAITGPAGSLTYAALRTQVARVASGLAAMGVRPEERVALVMSDRPETAVMILAVMRMGAVAVPLSTMYTGGELAELIRDSRARLVVTSPEFAPTTTTALTPATPTTSLTASTAAAGTLGSTTTPASDPTSVGATPGATVAGAGSTAIDPLAIASTLAPAEPASATSATPPTKTDVVFATNSPSLSPLAASGTAGGDATGAGVAEAGVADSAMSFTASTDSPAIEGSSGLLVPLIVTGDSAWEALVAHGEDAPPNDTWEDSPALWLYTSGTTGTPKAAMHRHAGVRQVCETYATQVLGITSADRCFSAAKLFFAYGLGNSLFFPLSAGATAVLDPARPTPAGVAERLATDRPTLFFGGPTFFAALLTADVPVPAFSSVRLAVSAGEALPAEIYRRFTTRYGVDIIDGIGSTEALHIFISNRPGTVRPGTSGTPVPGYEAKLVGEDAAPVPDGEPGHLLVRGDSIATGYWCRTAATRQVFLGEWLRTGDTYVRSADGFYTCLGRSNDMIKAGGIWVSPNEVEARLIEHPSVAECAVVPYISSDGLERPIACVVPAPGQAVDPAELVRFCREGLAAFKRPREVLVVDSLPKTATGKIRRIEVRDLAANLLRKSTP